jgi:hypothetical protein
MWWEVKVLFTAGILSIVAGLLWDDVPDGWMKETLKKLRYAFAVMFVLIFLWWIWGPTQYTMNPQTLAPEKLEKP